MHSLRNFIRKYEDFERPNLVAPHAIWEVHAVKLMAFFLGLLVAALLPQVLDVPWPYFAAGAAVCAAYPGGMAIVRLLRKG
jgi:hypothetical protein